MEPVIGLNLIAASVATPTNPRPTAHRHHRALRVRSNASALMCVKKDFPVKLHTRTHAYRPTNQSRGTVKILWDLLLLPLSPFPCRPSPSPLTQHGARPSKNDVIIDDGRHHGYPENGVRADASRPVVVVVGLTDDIVCPVDTTTLAYRQYHYQDGHFQHSMDDGTQQQQQQQQ